MTKHQPEVRWHGFYEEAIGVLTELTKEEGSLIVGISKVVLVLWPKRANKLHNLWQAHRDSAAQACPKLECAGIA